MTSPFDGVWSVHEAASHVYTSKMRHRAIRTSARCAQIDDLAEKLGEDRTVSPPLHTAHGRSATGYAVWRSGPGRARRPVGVTSAPPGDVVWARAQSLSCDAFREQRKERRARRVLLELVPHLADGALDQLAGDGCGGPPPRSGRRSRRGCPIRSLPSRSPCCEEGSARSLSFQWTPRESIRLIRTSKHSDRRTPMDLGAGGPVERPSAPAPGHRRSGRRARAHVAGRGVLAARCPSPRRTRSLSTAASMK